MKELEDGMRIAAVFFYILLTAPVSVSLHLHTGAASCVHGLLCVRIYTARIVLPLRICKEKGRFYLYLTQKKRVLLHLGKNRRLNMRFSPLRRQLKSWRPAVWLRVNARIGLPDAAQTALLCGALQGAIGGMPHLRGRILPDYRRSGYAVDFRGIAFFRMGKLFLTCAMLGIARLRRNVSGGAAVGNHKGSADQLGHADSP